jgi:hypothetical protein
LAERIGRALEGRGVLVRDAESSFLELDAAAGGPIDDLLGHSITYRVAVGPRAGQKVFSLQTVPAPLVTRHCPRGDDVLRNTYPPTERMAQTSSGYVRYQLKTPYRDGTTHIVIEPLDFMARLAALVPPPRMHLTRYHGVFAPHSKLRAAVTPAHRGIGAAQRAGPAIDSVKPPGGLNFLSAATAVSQPRTRVQPSAEPT